MIKATILGSGTSQGVPIIGCKCRTCVSTDKRDKRLRSSVLITDRNATVVIDAGPDFRYQMLREQVGSIDAILFTHGHKDHTGGLDDVRAFNYINKRSVDIYANEQTMGIIKKDYDYAFEEKPYPGVPELTPHIIDGKEDIVIKSMRITPIEGMHYKMKVLGYRIGKLGYITDMNAIADDQIERLRGIDTLIINALRREKHLSHFSLPEALAVIEKVAPRQAFLTHISHQMGLYSELEKELPQGVRAAYDRLTIEIE